MADVFELIPDPATGSVKINANFAGAAQVSVYRLQSDGSMEPVRACDPWPFPNMHGVHDFEAPFGPNITYVAIPRDAAGVALPSGSVAKQVSVDTFDDDWLRPITRPLDGLKVLVESYRVLTRPGRSSTFDVLNRPSRLAVSMPRAMPKGTMVLTTLTNAERVGMENMLDSGEPLVFLSPSRYGIGKQYLSVGSVTESRIGDYAAEPARKWALEVEQIAFPTGYTAEWAFTTWGDIRDKKIDWATVRDTYPDWGTIPQSDFHPITTPLTITPMTFGF